MGVTTNGQLCFGLLFEDEYEFPWGGDLEEWWLKQIGYKPTHGEGTERFWADRRAALLANPCPVVEVNYCSGEVPMYILAIPESVKTALRGDPMLIEPHSLSIPDIWVKTLADFRDRYELEAPLPPAWYLSSYWG